MGKTKALISFAVTTKLICVFVFAYAKSRFSHDAVHIHLLKDRFSHNEARIVFAIPYTYFKGNCAMEIPHSLNFRKYTVNE